MFEVVCSFENKDVAVKAAELLAVAFPMLTFEFRQIPEIDFNAMDLEFLQRPFKDFAYNGEPIC